MRIVREEHPISQLDVELINLRDAKEQLKQIQDRVDIQTELVAMLLDNEGKKSKTVGNHRYTLVRAERTKIDESGLKKALGARAFNRLTVARIDQQKVKDAVADGSLDPIILEQHAEVVQNKPSIRISPVEPEDG